MDTKLSFQINQPPVVVVDHLKKQFGEKLVLNDLCFKISPGITGLLGPNGAGKSTFLKLFLGFRPSIFRDRWQHELVLYYCPIC